MDSAHRAIEAVAAGRETFACHVCARKATFPERAWAVAYGWRRVEHSERWLCPFCVTLGGANRQVRRAAKRRARRLGVG